MGLRTGFGIRVLLLNSQAPLLVGVEVNGVKLPGDRQTDRGVYGETFLAGWRKSGALSSRSLSVFRSYFKAPWNWPVLESGKLCLIPACL